MKRFLMLFFVPLAVHAQSNFERGEAYYGQEQYQLAKVQFEKHLKQNPSDKKTLEYLGDIAGYSKDWDSAIPYYEALVVREPGNANYNFKYGGALGLKAKESSKLKALGLIGDVKEHFHKAAKLDPQHIEVRWALVELYMQLPGIIGGSESKSKRYAEELMKISPVDGYLANGYIAEYSDRAKDAEYYYRKAVELGDSPHTYEKLSEHYEKQNKPRKALETAQTSLKKHKRNSLNYQIGKIAAQYNIDPMLGIKCLMAYIDNYKVRDGVPVDWAYYRLAQIYRNMGKKTEALDWIDKALASRPDFEQALEERRQIQSL